MVLQRDVAVPIWGVDSPGGGVRVSVGARSWRAVADVRGRWRADIGPFGVGDAFSIRVEGSSTVVLDDVLAGEVWLAAGQSNMEWPLESAEGGPQELGAADAPRIRLLAIPHRGSAEPQEFAEHDGWQRCGRESARGFSAVAYWFARDLEARLDVPVGIVAAHWGGAMMESFTPLEAMSAEPEFAWTAAAHDEHAALLNSPAMARYAMQAAEHLEATGWRGSYADAGDVGLREGWESPLFDDSAWTTATIPADMKAIATAQDGAIWLRRWAEVPAGWEGAPLVLELGAINGEDSAFVNGVRVGGRRGGDPGYWTERRRYAVPAGVAKPGRNCIAVRLFEQAIDHPIFTQCGAMGLRRADGGGAPVPIGGEWRVRVPEPLLRRPRYPIPQARDVPAMIWNGMIRPLAPFRFRGAIWYQGEANNARAAQYRRLTEVMLCAWRRAFGHGFPFLYVQLAGFDTPADWPGLREAQRQCQSIPGAAMATAVDIGEADDIHPRNKREVARRLALVARARVYGESVECSGPVAVSAKAEGGGIRVAFSHVGGGLVSRLPGEPIVGFEVDDGAGGYRPAEARIEGDSVVISAPPGGRIRYAWRSFPECDLYNADGLPAAPFEVAVEP